MTGDERAAWEREWDPVIDLVGQDLGDGTVTFGADRVEYGTVRRFVEPLELGCRLHVDPGFARAHGWPDVIAPYSSMLMYSVPPLWSPGDPPVFVDEARNAQPARSPISGFALPAGPRTTGFFAVSQSVDYHRPLYIGDRIGQRGQVLVSCTPKRTSVGRGAFVTWSSSLVTTEGEVVADLRTTTFYYRPHEEDVA